MTVTREQLAERVLIHYREATGYRFAHDCQQKRGALRPGQRLLPKRPFVLGGEFNFDNLNAHAALFGMRMRGGVAGEPQVVGDPDRSASFNPDGTVTGP